MFALWVRQTGFHGYDKEEFLSDIMPRLRYWCQHQNAWCPKGCFTEITLVLQWNTTLFAINRQQKLTLRSYRQCSNCCPPHLVLLAAYWPSLINKYFTWFLFAKFIMLFEYLNFPEILNSYYTKLEAFNVTEHWHFLLLPNRIPYPSILSNWTVKITSF
jgi:hypothetical protein